MGKAKNKEPMVLGRTINRGHFQFRSETLCGLDGGKFGAEPEKPMGLL